MRKLRYTSEALDNLADITAYIAVSSGIRTLGEGFVAQIREQCIRLASLPGTLGRERSELGADLRSFAYKGYIIFFRYRGEYFEVAAVLEGHRDVDGYFGGDDTD